MWTWADDMPAEKYRSLAKRLWKKWPLSALRRDSVSLIDAWALRRSRINQLNFETISNRLERPLNAKLNTLVRVLTSMDLASGNYFNKHAYRQA